MGCDNEPLAVTGATVLEEGGGRNGDRKAETVRAWGKCGAMPFREYVGAAWVSSSDVSVRQWVTRLPLGLAVGNAGISINTARDAASRVVNTRAVGAI